VRDTSDVHLIAQFSNPFQIVWNVLVGALILYVVVRLAIIPAAEFEHGRRTKIFWLIVALGVSPRLPVIRYQSARSGP